MKEYKCPKCGMTATDKDFDNNTSVLSYSVGMNGIWYWECFECNHKWREKDGEIYKR